MSIVDSIVEEREKNGPYKSLQDFVQRADFKKVTKKQLENLVDAGTFDCFEPNKDLALAILNDLYDTFSREKKEAATGVLTFFSLDSMARDPVKITVSPKNVIQRSPKELLKREKELLGVYLTAHPMDAVEHMLPFLSVVPARDFEGLPHGTIIRTVFLIDKVTTKISSAEQKKFALLQVSDEVDSYELPIWADMYAEYHDLLEEDRLIYAILAIDRRSDSLRLSCRWMRDLSTVNDSVIAECNEVYDRLKSQKVYSSTKKSTGAQSSAMIKKVETREISPVTISLDLNKLRHSHLFILKGLIRKYSGSQALSLVFTKDNQRFASISPDADFFVTDDISSLLQEIEATNIPARVLATTV